MSRSVQSVNCEEIHSGRLLTNAAYKASAEQLFTEQMIKNWTTFITGNVHDSCYSHIRLLPTHPLLTSTDFIRLLPVATFAGLHIRLLPIAYWHDFFLFQTEQYLS